MSFRAHPNYQKKGPWYDCISTKWENNDGYYEIPAHCIIFTKVDNDIKVLCQTCDNQTFQEKELNFNFKNP